MQDEYLIKLEASVERHELLQVARRLAVEYNLDAAKVESMFKEGGTSLTLVLPERQAKHVAREFRRAGFRPKLVRQAGRFSVKTLFFPYGRFALPRATVLLVVALVLAAGFLLWPHLLAAGSNATVEGAVVPSATTERVTTERAATDSVDAVRQKPAVKKEGDHEVESEAVAEQVSVFDAVVARDTQLLQELIQAGKGLDVRDPYGQTPLMYAVDHRHEEVVQMLLDAGAQLDAHSDAGWTALMYASRDPHAIELLRALLNAGADLTLRNADGQSARDLAVMHGNTEAVRALDATAALRHAATAQRSVSQSTRHAATAPVGPSAPQVTARPAAAPSSTSRSRRADTSRQVLLNCLQDWDSCGTD